MEGALSGGAEQQGETQKTQKTQTGANRSEENRAPVSPAVAWQGPAPGAVFAPAFICVCLRLFAFFAFQFFRPVSSREWSPRRGHNKSRFRSGVPSEDGGGDALRPGVFVAGRFAGRMERVTPMPGCGAAMAGSIVRGGARRGAGGAEKAKRKKRKKRKQAQTDQRKTGRRSVRP